MNEIEVYTDRPQPLREALRVITDEWVESGECCNQTTIDLANACRKLLAEIHASQYKGHESGQPFSSEGLLDMAHQCLDASREQDSSLLEMAGLALRRVAHGRLQSDSTQPLSRLLACCDQAEQCLSEGVFTYRDLDRAAVEFEKFAGQLRKTELTAPRA